jgi:hypothetical protein
LHGSLFVGVTDGASVAAALCNPSIEPDEARSYVEATSARVLMSPSVSDEQASRAMLALARMGVDESEPAALFTRIARRLGIHPDNREALTALSTDRWWEFTRDSPEVKAAKLMYPGP